MNQILTYLVWNHTWECSEDFFWEEQMQENTLQFKVRYIVIEIREFS